MARAAARRGPSVTSWLWIFNDFAGSADAGVASLGVIATP